MSRQPPAKRAQRLQEIAQEVGAILVDFDPSPLLPPPKPPSFMVHDDDRKADSILVQLRVEESASKQQSRRLSSAFGKSQKPTVYSYTELYQAMIRAIEENERPGVLEVLLKRFKAVEGDINLARRGSTSMVKRVRGKEEQDERGRLLYVATGNCRVDFVQLLAPLADEQSLNESLDVALAKRELDIVELLVRYGMLMPSFCGSHFADPRQVQIQHCTNLLSSTWPSMETMNCLNCYCERRRGCPNHVSTEVFSLLRTVGPFSAYCFLPGLEPIQIMAVQRRSCMQLKQRE